MVTLISGLWQTFFGPISWIGEAPKKQRFFFYLNECCITEVWMQTFFVDNFQLKICLLSRDILSWAGFFRLRRRNAFWEKDGNEGVLERKNHNTLHTENVFLSTRYLWFSCFYMCVTLLVFIQRFVKLAPMAANSPLMVPQWSPSGPPVVSH